jgi:signal transduction histidine kinase
VLLEDVEIGVVIGEVLDLVRPLATSSDIALVGRPVTGVPRVHADQRCVRQVLINLIANAVKYTPVGGRVQVGAACGTKGMVRISITDSGPGIPPDSIAELFQPFHRLEQDGLTAPKEQVWGLLSAPG